MSLTTPSKQPTVTDKSKYLHSELTEQLIGSFYEVYNELGYGFLESVYEAALFKVPSAKELNPQRQVATPVWFRGEKSTDFCADLLVNNQVLLELKAVRVLEPCHEAQLLNYLRATPVEIGLLLNFGPRPIVRPMVFSNERKISAPQR